MTYIYEVVIQERGKEKPEHRHFFADEGRAIQSTRASAYERAAEFYRASDMEGDQEPPTITNWNDGTLVFEVQDHLGTKVIYFTMTRHPVIN